MSSRLVHAAARIRLSPIFMAEPYSTAWINRSAVGRAALDAHMLLRLSPVFSCFGSELRRGTAVSRGNAVPAGGPAVLLPSTAAPLYVPAAEA